MIVEWVVVAIVVASDQITKYLIETNMHLWQSITLVKNVLNLIYVKNTGVGFSFLSNNEKIVEIVTSTLIIFLIAFSIFWKGKKDWFFNLSMGLIIGGALSNVINRIFTGNVTDFIQVPYWPIFNVADSCVVAGAIGIGIYFLKRDGKGGEDRIESHNKRSG